MQQLEGFQYVTALYINTGYYTIRIFPGSQDMTTKVTEFGKIQIQYSLYGNMSFGRYITFQSGQTNQLYQGRQNIYQ